jgi:hypothetical protein
VRFCEKARALHTNGPRDAPRYGAQSLQQKPQHHMEIQKNYCPAILQRVLTQMFPAPAFTAQRPSRGHVSSHIRHHLGSLFCCETPVAKRIAPSRLILTESTRLRAAARLAATSPLTVKFRRRCAWRSHGRHRVRRRSSRVAVASLSLLGAAARIHAGRSHGRHRVRQHSGRIHRRPLPPRRRLPSLRAPP